MKKLFFIVALLQFGVALLGAPGAARAQPPYSNADFKGTWGFGVSGTVIFTPPSPPTANCVNWTPASISIALEGTLTGDGVGGLTGIQTFNVGGVACSGTLTGTYTITTNGTGTLNNVTFTAAPGSSPQCATVPGNSALTFSAGVNHIDLAGTDCFQVTSGSATKQ